MWDTGREWNGQMITILKETPKNPITLMGERAGVCWGADTDNKEKNYKRGLECIKSGHHRVLEYVNVEGRGDDPGRLFRPGHQGMVHPYRRCPHQTPGKHALYQLQKLHLYNAAVCVGKSGGGENLQGYHVCHRRSLQPPGERLRNSPGRCRHAPSPWHVHENCGQAKCPQSDRDVSSAALFQGILGVPPPDE